MSLASLLSSEQIIPEMKATERWPAIVELIDLLVARQKIDPASRDEHSRGLEATRGNDEHRHRFWDRDSACLL